MTDSYIPLPYERPIWTPPHCNHQFAVKHNGTSATSGQCARCGHPVIIIPSSVELKNGETVKLKGKSWSM